MWWNIRKIHGYNLLLTFLRVIIVTLSIPKVIIMNMKQIFWQFVTPSYLVTSIVTSDLPIITFSIKTHNYVTWSFSDCYFWLLQSQQLLLVICWLLLYQTRTLVCYFSVMWLSNHQATKQQPMLLAIGLLLLFHSKIVTFPHQNIIGFIKIVTFGWSLH